MPDRPNPSEASTPGDPVNASSRETPQSAPANADSDRRVERHFDPRRLDASVIALPLLKALSEDKAKRRDVIIDLNLAFSEGTELASEKVKGLIRQLPTAAGEPNPADTIRESGNGQYVYARLTSEEIFSLVASDAGETRASASDRGQQATPELPPGTVSKTAAEKADMSIPRAHRAIYRIWPDFPVRALINKSVSTVKADAARISFAATGEGVTWAVLDSGIDQDHLHFGPHGNLSTVPLEWHRDFVGAPVGDGSPATASVGKSLADPFGHGTHVAGIIAGEFPFESLTERNLPPVVKAVVREKKESDTDVRYLPMEITAIAGMAPKCRLVSLRVLDEDGNGVASSMIDAIDHIQQINKYGRFLQIHGVNMSVGYDFDPEWFACGQSPLCIEVDRLVHSGVVVVVAAGNSGYGILNTTFRGEVTAGLSLTINDPGNADLAITVGSTHRDSPHTYGISYFSSKGPTGDGRLKPDLVAPGEKIISCAAGSKRLAPPGENPSDYPYVEESGTSMAAPHVSGVIAGFLSIRREYIGKPEEVKEVFLRSATDLKRERYFQGSGLVDLMRAIQSV
jgi:serine protease AprX